MREEKKPRDEIKSLWIASDHAGFDLKQFLIQASPSLPWRDLGPETNSRVDYPDFAEKLANTLKTHPSDFGVLICGSGQGMAIKANRYDHIRAALCWNEEVAQLARGHNNANVLCLGSRLLDHELCIKILDTFLSTPFEGGRHADRVNKLKGNSHATHSI
ncbi:MAG: RpiB/LacA/LacB family sugar-phosphate isomerase [Bdellovibrionales bacterium]|nr:RpiB/LacA/LacB family sugar-phosphate isomerase [Bdellovibrionales bacterium]